MADEFNISFRLNLSNGAQFDRNEWSGQVDQSAIGRGGHVQSVGTSEEALDFGDVGTEGYCSLQNLDPTNYVEWGPDSGGSAGSMVPVGRLNPGEPPAFFRLKSGVTVKAQANTAACLVDVRVYED